MNGESKLNMLNPYVFFFLVLRIQCWYIIHVEWHAYFMSTYIFLLFLQDSMFSHILNILYQKDCGAMYACESMLEECTLCTELTQFYVL